MPKKRVYLDAAAATPIEAAAARAYTRALVHDGNPSAPHTEGRAARAILEEARRTIATLAASRPESIIFTSGATEANALALTGHIHALIAGGRAPERIHVLYLPSAHASLVGNVEALRAEGVRIEALPLVDGVVDETLLKSRITPDTALVSMDAVCGETGTRFDTRGMRHFLDSVRAPGESRIVLHVDASQLPLVESFERTRIGGDLIVLDAGKVGSVRGIGVLIRQPNVPLKAVSEGGGQEQGFRSGTEAVASAAAFAAALTFATDHRDTYVARTDALGKQLAFAVLSAIPHVVLNRTKSHVPHIINFSLPGRDTDYLVALLDEAGFAVSTRSACETDAGVSRAVKMLFGDDSRAASTLRVSFPRSVREGDVQRFAEALIRAVRFLDESAASW